MEKKFTVVSHNTEAALTRRKLAVDMIVHDLRSVAYNEKRGRLSTRFEHTVAGHPRRVREYRDMLRSESGFWSSSGLGGAFDDFIVGEIVAELVVPGFRAGKRKWQGRNDPPLG